MKRLLAALVWFFTGWYCGSVMGWALDLGPALAPVIGVAAAVIALVDPRRIGWNAPSPRVGGRFHAIGR